MRVLVDTNVLARLAQANHPQHAVAQQALDELKKRGEKLCVAAQNVYEFWTVCTRPISSQNGLGMSVDAAKAELSRIYALFTLLRDIPAVFDEWQSVVLTYNVKGKSAHDARLVAAMEVHGVEQILTFNGSDFTRFPGVTVLQPGALPNHQP